MVNQKVEGKKRSGQQAVFNVMGDLEFDYPCTDKASGDMLAWGEVPNAVLMHDTNVTFEYDCGNTNPELPFWTITGGALYSFPVSAQLEPPRPLNLWQLWQLSQLNSAKSLKLSYSGQYCEALMGGASEDPDAANTLYLGSKDYVEVASLKVQGLAYRTRPGEYFMSNLFFGTVTASGSAGRVAGHRAAFSYHTDNDKALKEVNAVDHGSPTLNATMMFRPKEGNICEAHGVIGTGKVSLLLGDADACKVNPISRGRVHAVFRCGAAASDLGTYVITTDHLSGGTIDLVAKSGFLVEIESGSLRLTGKNANQDTWNTVLTLQQQTVSSGDKAEAVAEPGTLQWAGKITAKVYVAMPRVHGNLRLFGAMTLKFRIMDDGPEIQSITAELEASYPVLRGDLPFWLRAKLKEHDACGAPEVGPGRTRLERHSTRLPTPTLLSWMPPA